MYKLYIYDVVKGFSRLIDENVSEADIPRIKRKYGSSSVVVDWDGYHCNEDAPVTGALHFFLEVIYWKYGET